MTLQRVEQYLDAAFERLDQNSLDQNNFDVDKNNWNSFWRDRNVSKEDLRAAKKDLIQRRVNSLKNSDEYEDLTRHIYCCNPFDEKIEKDLKSCWERKCESQPDPYCSYYQRITVTIKKRRRQYVRRLGRNLWRAIEQDLPWLAFVLTIIYEFISSRLHNIHIPSNLQRCLNGLRRQWKVFLVGIVSLIIIIVLVVCFIMLILDIHEIDRQGSSALNSFKSNEIEALENAIVAGNRLNNLNQNYFIKFFPLSFLQKALPTHPVLALQTIHNEIHEKNRLAKKKNEKYLFSAISYNQSPSLVVAGSDDGKLWLWNEDEDTRNFTKNKLTNQGKIYSLSFSSIGKQVASGGANGSVKLWDSESLNLESELPKCHENAVLSLSFSQDDTYLVSGGNDGKLCRWNLKEKPLNKEEKKISEERIWDVAYKPKSQVFSIVKGDGIVDFMNIESFEKIASHNFQQGLIFDIAFDQTGTRIATASKNGKIRLWEWQDETPIIDLQEWDVYPDNDTNPFIHISFNSENELLATVENQDLLKVFKFEETRVNPLMIMVLKGYASKKSTNINKLESSTLTPDGQYLYSAASEEEIRVWDISNQFRHLKTFTTQQNSIKKLRLLNKSNSDSNPTVVFLASLDKNGSVKFLTRDGNPVYNKSDLANETKIAAANFTLDGTLVTADSEGTIKFWSLNGSLLNQLNTGTTKKNIVSISFHPSESIIAVADERGVITLLDWSTNDPGRTLPDPNQGPAKFMKFSPNGQRLLTVRKDNPSLYDVSGRSKPKEIELLEAPNFPGGINSIGFSPEGYSAIAAKEDGKIYFWDDSGQYIRDHELDTEQQGVINFEFSQQPRRIWSQPTYLATLGPDNSIKVWDWQKREPIANFKSELSTITSFDFSADGKYVVVGGEDSKVELWQIFSLEELLDKSCEWLKDYHNNESRSNSPVAQICKSRTS